MAKFKFAHMADCHLGSWRHPKLQELNIESFRKAIDICIKEKVNFIVISGDLFDSAYPPIEILKETFSQFRKLKDEKIPCFIIAGSHDYSVSGKTFLDVLEKAGFCKNVYNAEERNANEILLLPTIYENVAIYGYPGKKAGLEIPELRKVKLQKAPGYFRLFLLHTTITDAKGSLPIDSVDESALPEADYYALGHLHVDYANSKFNYAGPIFPNNFEELEELKQGSFYIVEASENSLSYKKIPIKIKDVLPICIEINNAVTAHDKIMKEISKHDIDDKIVLLRVEGKLRRGRTSDIRFSDIENFVKDKSFALLKNTSGIKTEEAEIKIEIEDIERVEEVIIKKYSEENPSKFNNLIPQLIPALELEKQEDEKTIVFENRLLEELRRILKF